MPDQQEVGEEGQRHDLPARGAGPPGAVWMFAFLFGFLLILFVHLDGMMANQSQQETPLPAKEIPFTLDGMAFMRAMYPGDYLGIQWLNAHVRGAQVIAEAYDSRQGYDWASRVSEFTGLPDIFNGIHEGEQRYPTDFQTRIDDVNTLYSTANVRQKWNIIEKYHVHYIFVGWTETHCTIDICYPPSGVGAFTEMVGQGLTIAFQNLRLGVLIYQVEQTPVR